MSLLECSYSWKRARSATPRRATLAQVLRRLRGFFRRPRATSSRFGFPLAAGRIEPYLAGGVGAARVKRDVSFTVAGNDVTSTIGQLGVTLGTDLSGSETKPMLTLGGGIAWLAWQHLLVDFQYRYGRVFTSGQSMNVSRAGLGLGVRF